MRPHVLVARQDSMGDVLLAGPAVRAVAAGAGRVTLLAGPRGRAAAALLPGVDEVLVWSSPWIDPEPGPVDGAAIEALTGEIAARGVDEGLILTSFHQSPLPLALLLRMAGVERVAAISVDYPGSLLTVRHQVADDLHEVERNLSLAGAVGYRVPPGDDPRLRVALPNRRLPEARGPYLVVHPGASVPSRAWSPERHAALVAELAARGWGVAVTGGAGERVLTAAVAGGAAGATGVELPAPGSVVDLGDRLDLPGLAAVLAGADAVVVGNTGPAHLAAAVGTPVACLFAPVVPAVRWRPWRVQSVLLGDQRAACAGSRARVCPVPGHPCLNDVAVDEVVAAVDHLTTRSATVRPIEETVRS
jgi:ADP-heptose:LPS heptosyltransferase